MNKRQRAKSESYVRVIDTVAKYPDQLKDVDGLMDEVKELSDLKTKIGAAGVVQNTQPLGSEASEAAKEKMAETLYKFAQRAYVKAKKAKNLPLQKQLDKPETYYTKSPKTEPVNRTKAILNVLKDNLTLFTNIKALEIAAIDAGINTCESIKDDAQDLEIATKASDTDVLKDLFVKADDVIENLLMLTGSCIARVHPEIFGELELSATLIIAVAVHKEIDITIIADEDGSNQPFAELMDPGMGKTYRPSVNHHIFIPTHKIGQVDFEIVAPGRIGISFVADIRKGASSFVIRLKNG